MIFKTVQNPPYAKEFTLQIIETTCPLCHQHVRFAVNPDDAGQFRERSEHWEKMAKHWQEKFEIIERYTHAILDLRDKERKD